MARAALPVRKHPSHNSVHEGNDNRSVVLFVTVCVAGKGGRGAVRLDSDEAHRCLVEAWRKADAWRVGRYVVMPDHVHFFCGPATNPMVPFGRWMGYWKRLVAQMWGSGQKRDGERAGNRDVAPPGAEIEGGMKRHGTVFQRDQWDTQLRTGESYSEKWEYVRRNPVRKGLAGDADDWPYQGELNVLHWHDR